MSKFNPQTIAITLITHYPKWYAGKVRSIKHSDKIRGDLALQTIRKALKDGYQMVVIDGSSSRSFRKQLTQTSNLYLKKRRSDKRSPNKRLGFKFASKLPDVKIIVATEPEKVSLIDYLPKIVEPILRNEAAIVVPRRKPKLFKATYPMFQYESEIEGNQFYNELLRQYRLLSSESPDLDLFFGPRAFANEPSVLALFMHKFRLVPKTSTFKQQYFDPEEYSNTLYFPIVLALKKGLRVAQIEIPFHYPKLQKENEGRQASELFLEKRRAQKLSLLLDLVLFLNFLKK